MRDIEDAIIDEENQIEKYPKGYWEIHQEKREKQQLIPYPVARRSELKTQFHNAPINDIQKLMTCQQGTICTFKRVSGKTFKATIVGKLLDRQSPTICIKSNKLKNGFTFLTDTEGVEEALRCLFQENRPMLLGYKRKTIKLVETQKPETNIPFPFLDFNKAQREKEEQERKERIQELQTLPETIPIQRDVMVEKNISEMVKVIKDDGTAELDILYRKGFTKSGEYYTTQAEFISAYQNEHRTIITVKLEDKVIYLYTWHKEQARLEKPEMLWTTCKAIIPEHERLIKKHRLDISDNVPPGYKVGTRGFTKMTNEQIQAFIKKMKGIYIGQLKEGLVSKMKTIYQYQLEEMNQQWKEESNHKDHGRGDEENGPWDTDCMCRGSDKQTECAKQGCGFCRAAEEG